MEDEVINQQPVENKLETDSKIFAALSYFSLLFIIPWVTKKEDKFVMFHVRQGVALFIAEVVIWIVLWLISSFLTVILSFGAFTLINFLYQLAWLVFVAISIIGIYYAVTGKEKALPWLWIISKNIKI